MKRCFYYLESEKDIDTIVKYVDKYEKEGLIMYRVDSSDCNLIINDLELEDIDELYTKLEKDGLIEDLDYEDEIDDHSFDDFEDDDDYDF